jgi:hypothetical protein
MNLIDMTNEMYRLSALIDRGITALTEAGQESAEADHVLSKAVATAWSVAPKAAVPERKAWVEAETAVEKKAFELAESKKYTALEAIRSRRTQMSALQSLLAAHRAEAEFVRNGLETH